MTDFQRDQIAKIHIQDLRLRTYIGINDDEKKNQQDVVINIRIHYHAEKAVSFNVIDEALNYRTITKKVIKHVESNRFLLLERMTDEVLSLVMEHPQVMWADVVIDKPHAYGFQIRYRSPCLLAERGMRAQHTRINSSQHVFDDACNAA